MTTMEQHQQNLKTWVDTLRSDEYKQARNRLRSGDKFCCLGVACDIIDSSKWNKHLTWDDVFTYGIDEHYMPNRVLKQYGLTEREQRELSALNDDGWTFDAIADEIEARYVFE